MQNVVPTKKYLAHLSLTKKLKKQTNKKTNGKTSLRM